MPRMTVPLVHDPQGKQASLLLDAPDAGWKPVSMLKETTIIALVDRFSGVLLKGEGVTIPEMNVTEITAVIAFFKALRRQARRREGGR